MNNRRVLLTARPEGLPKPTDFRLVETPAPEPGDGEMLLRTLYLSLDPYMRGRMRAAKSYAPPVPLDEVMVGGVVGEVTASRHPDYAVGDIVEGRTGWQEYGLSDGAGMRRVDPSLAPVSTALGILGMPGLTAYFGLRDIGRVEAGDTVLVTAASGAVGAVVGQIAKIMGCYVVGVAGGPQKTAYILDELGFDAAIDYKSGADLGTAVATACPKGVDVYYDNVGGAISDVALDHLARGARVVICGTISQTSLEEPEPGPRVQGKLMTAWASMQAFNVFQFADRHDEARAQLAQWLAHGTLKYREDVVDGLENAPAAFIGMLQGKNFGKLVVKVAEG
ncbi:MAG: NADP-dependent oxidoreductase [Pseudomonadota bacterium]|nr:NADP-dependent oxidoreductase [Pseudomonadota bacterium]